MKQWIRRGAALGLALALTVTAASASQAMGWDVHTGRAPLSQGASLGKNVFWSDTYSDLRTEYYVEYSPNASVVPTVAYGSKVTDRVTLSGMAQTLESQGKRVVSGLNGDWYVLSTGAPTGLVVTDGIVRATGYYNDTWAIGFNADGTAFIARNGLSVSVSFGGQAVKLGGGINKVRKLTDSAAVGGLTLLTDAFGFMASTVKDLPAGRVLEALASVSSAAGSAGMVGGQILDMDCTGKTDVPLETLQTLHALKTGAMFRVACVSGGLLAGASESDIASLRAYGEALGVTFQIVDDILDETADTATLGKPAGSDAEMGKTTYPSLMGLNRSRELAQEFAEKAVDSLSAFSGQDAAFLKGLALMLVTRNK